MNSPITNDHYFRRCKPVALSVIDIKLKKINSMERSSAFHHHPTCGELLRVSTIIEDELPGKSIQIELEAIVVPPSTLRILSAARSRRQIIVSIERGERHTVVNLRLEIRVHDVIYISGESRPRIPIATPTHVDPVLSCLALYVEVVVFHRIPGSPIQRLHFHSQFVFVGAGQLVDLFQTQPEIRAGIAKPGLERHPWKIENRCAACPLLEYYPVVDRPHRNWGADGWEE